MLYDQWVEACGVFTEHSIFLQMLNYLVFDIGVTLLNSAVDNV